MSKQVNIPVSFEVFTLWSRMNERYETRVVGGAVRDAVMGAAPKDIDFCTTATPDQMIEFAADYGYRVEPTGMQHGTVSFIVGGEAYEFTTLRVDNDCDGRHATVQFTTDFEADAARRDFTFNAMSADINGNVYDYFGGWYDAKIKIVRFVGNCADRIAEDYLRVLRFFRFAARYDVMMDWKAIEIMCFPEVHEGLGRISRERIWAEMSKIASYGFEARTQVMTKMRLTGVTEAIGMEPNRFAFDCIQNAKTPAAFMAGFCGFSPETFGRSWKMSVDEIKEMSFVYNAGVSGPMTSQSVMFSRLMGVDKSHMTSACEVHAPELVAFATPDYPSFPLTGTDLMEEGFAPGRALGEELARRKQAWAEALSGVSQPTVVFNHQHPSK